MQRENLNQILQEVKKAVYGKDDVLEMVLTCILAQGHILLDDIPGVGKTTMAMAFSKAMELEQKRIQFTPDVMPSDVTGFTMLDKAANRFVFRKGAVFCNLLLADEINRTVCTFRGNGRISGDGRRKGVQASEAIYRDCDTESHRFCRNTYASGIAA